MCGRIRTSKCRCDIANAPVGEHVRVAIAMVDEGILNITKYESPNPVNYFFGRRALGVDLRDDYGRLLNPNLGAPATIASGRRQSGRRRPHRRADAKPWRSFPTSSMSAAAAR